MCAVYMIKKKKHYFLTRKFDLKETPLVSFYNPSFIQNPVAELTRKAEYEGTCNRNANVLTVKKAGCLAFKTKTTALYILSTVNFLCVIQCVS